jgi:transketolase
MRNQFVQTMTEIMEKDQNPYLLLGDIGVWGFRHILEKYPERAKNLGICEQAMIGVAAGLSISGFNPVVHTIAPFIVERAYEQLKIDFSYQELGGNFVSVGASYDYDKLGATHHCPADVAILQQIPNMQIVVPGTAKEFDILFQQSYDNGQPAYYRLSEYSNDESYDVGFGCVLPLSQTGTRFTMLVAGPAYGYIKELLSVNSGINVLYCTTIAPLDLETIGKHIVNNKLMIVEPYYSTILPEIVNAFPNVETVSVAHDKKFVSVGFDPKTDIVKKVVYNIQRLKW